MKQLANSDHESAVGRRRLPVLLLLAMLAFSIAACSQRKAASDPGADGNVYNAPYVGVYVVTPTKFLRGYYHLPEQPGVLAIAVLPGSPADKAGLKEGALITAVGSDAVPKPDFFQNLILKRQVGGIVQLSLFDANAAKSRTLRITTAARPVKLNDLFAQATNERLKQNKDDAIALILQGLDYQAAAQQAATGGSQDQAILAVRQSYVSFSQAVELQPNFDMAYYQRGLLTEAIGDAEGALKDQSKAIELDPGFAPPYTERANLYSIRQQAGDLEAGIQDAQKALALDPLSTAPLGALGRLYGAMNRSTEATAAYYRYLAFPDSSIGKEAALARIAQLNYQYIGIKTQGQQ